MMLKKKPTLSSQTRWGKLFNLMKMNKHMIPKNDANICPLYEKTKSKALIGVNKKSTLPSKSKMDNTQSFNSFQIIRFKGISFRSDRLSHVGWTTYPPPHF